MNIEDKWRADCRLAINEFDESGKLATNMVPDALRHAIFREGYLPARRKAQEEIDKANWQKSIISKANDNQIIMIEKRDKLLEQAVHLVKEAKRVYASETSNTRYNMKDAEEWLKEVGEII